MNPITCIIVDDEPLAVKLMESFVNRTPQLQLERSFTDSVEALTWLREHPVNQAFMDIQMPTLSGTEATKLLRQKKYAGIIIACTANNDSSTFEKYRN